MSSDQVEIINGIKEKIQTVKLMLHTQLEENEKLKKTNNDLKSALQQQLVKIENLEQKNQKINLTRGFLAESEDAHDAKIAINRIVREIDKCIALLNR